MARSRSRSKQKTSGRDRSRQHFGNQRRSRKLSRKLHAADRVVPRRKAQPYLGLRRKQQKTKTRRTELATAKVVANKTKEPARERVEKAYTASRVASDRRDARCVSRPDPNKASLGSKNSGIRFRLWCERRT